MNSLLALADRVAALPAGDREVDWLVFAACYRWAADGRKVFEECPLSYVAYTSSLDAVLSLIGEKLPGQTWKVGMDPEPIDGRQFYACVRPQKRFREAATPALALLSAALRALASQGDPDAR